MKIVTAALFILSLAAVSYAAELVKPATRTGNIAPAGTTYACPKQTQVYVVKTNKYNQDGWNGISGAGTVTVNVTAHYITPDKLRMYCDYAAPGSIGVERNIPSGSTCTPAQNFTFVCTPAR